VAKLTGEDLVCSTVYIFLRMAAISLTLAMMRRFWDILHHPLFDDPWITRITSRRITRETKPTGMIRALVRRSTMSKASLSPPIPR